MKIKPEFNGLAELGADFGHHRHCRIDGAAVVDHLDPLVAQHAVVDDEGDGDQKNPARRPEQEA